MRSLPSLKFVILRYFLGSMVVLGKLIELFHRGFFMRNVRQIPFQFSFFFINRGDGFILPPVTLFASTFFT